MKHKIIYLIVCVFFTQACNGKGKTMEKTSLNVSNDTTELFYLIKEPKYKTGSKKALILLHGVGSNEEDLFNLTSQLPDEFYIICPRGKFTYSEGSYAWYDVSFASGKPVYDQQQESQSRNALLTFIEEMKEAYNLEDVYIGGFSQGAIMSYSIGLTAPEKIKGVISFSGRILEDIKSNIVLKDANLKTKFFISHGINDQILQLEYAHDATKFLDDLKINYTYLEFNGGHEINKEVLYHFVAWLETIE